MKVWITRNRSLIVALVNIYTAKPMYKSGIFVSSKHYITCIDIKSFKHLFGFTPRKGSCQEYELVIKKEN